MQLKRTNVLRSEKSRGKQRNSTMRKIQQHCCIIRGNNLKWANDHVSLGSALRRLNRHHLWRKPCSRPPTTPRDPAFLTRRGQSARCFHSDVTRLRLATAAKRFKTIWHVSTTHTGENQAPALQSRRMIRIQTSDVRSI